MVITIDDKVSADETLRPVIEKTNSIIQEIFRRVPDAPSVTWRPSSLLPSGSSVELEFSYDREYVARDFRLDQLTNERDLRFALTSLWGELIMLAFGSSSERLIQALREIRTDEVKHDLHLQGA